MSDPLDQLGRLAPDVDDDVAAAAFATERARRRRQRNLLTGVAAAVLVALVAIPAAIGLSGLGDDDAPVAAGGDSTTPQPDVADTLPGTLSFEVLAVLELTTQEMGTMRAALDAETYDELWAGLEPEGATAPAKPQVDFDASFVITITIPDDACAPTLVRFEAPENAFVPVFVETATACNEPLIPKTYVVAVERAGLPDTVVFRLPPDDLYGLPEHELVIDQAAGSVDGEVSVTTVPATEPTVLPGDPVESPIRAGAELVAVGLADGEFLAVHELPTEDSDVVAELLWNDIGIIATGQNRSVAGTAWNEIRFEGTVGWAPAPELRLRHDDTEEIIDELFPGPADRPIADDIGALVLKIVPALGTTVEEVVTFDFPDDTRAPGTLRVDVLGLGDEATDGVRLLVTADVASGGDGLTVTSIQRRHLCSFGVSEAGCR